MIPAKIIRLRLWLLPIIGLVLAVQARAYIDLAPTITKVMADSQKIAVVEVTEFNEASHIVTLKEIRALKGELGSAPIRHDVASADGVIPSSVVQWADPGARGVLFASRTTALVCFGEGWYQMKFSGGEWKLGIDRPDLALTYYGTVSRLADGIATMLAGGDAILTMVQHGIDDAASFDLALNRTNLPSLIRLQRIRANMKMPTTVMAVSVSSTYVIGVGRVGEEEIPALTKQLGSPDAAVRTEAAIELQELGRKAQPAAAALTKLLADSAVRVRIEAASALLHVGGKNDNAVKVLADSLANTDARVRRAAAVAVGRAGSGAAPLVSHLADVLKDRNVSVQYAAIQAVATLGPVASGAASALVPLLNEPKLCIAAADALGRIGPAARPLPGRLVEMLAADQPVPVQLAAVRAMAQIGGPEAHPAVDFIAKAMPSAKEIEAYNMEIYLSLLGPVATDAISVAQNAKLGHPVLPSATVWAIKADSLPWQMTGGGGGRGGFGPGGGGRGGPGGGPGGGMGFDLFSTLYMASLPSGH